MVATTVKLARALWIVPLTLATAAVRARRAPQPTARAPIVWPWFILFFLCAAVVNSYVPALRPLTPLLARAGRVGLTVTLFLIGSGLSRASLRRVGPRPLLHGVLLWIIVAVASLAIVRAS